jgi:hypothetical protein
LEAFSAISAIRGSADVARPASRWWCQGPAEVAVRLLDQQQVAEAAGVAQEGEVVGAASLAFQLAGESQPQLGLADQVQRHVGERDVLLQHRRVAAPLRHPVAEDQAVVAEPERVFERRVRGQRVPGRNLGLRRNRHHIGPTSSGMSKKVGWR